MSSRSSPPAEWSSPCPVCGQTVVAFNQVTVGDADGPRVTGFAESPAEMAALQGELVTLLQAMDADASLHDVIEVMAKVPGFELLTRWLEANQTLIQSIAAGASVVALVLTMLQFLGIGPAQQEATPPGITHEQMDELISELKRSDMVAPSPAVQEQDQPQQGQGGKAGGTNQKPAGPDARRDRERTPTSDARHK